MDAVGIIFSNIHDSTLSELTSCRTVASLPFGARYRQIDFILSNMSNSDVEKIGIITKYNYQSLMDHLGSCQEWDLNTKNRDLKILPPYATGHNGIYRGKLDALGNSLDFLMHSDAEYVILADTTTICAIDFYEVLQEHISSGCDVTAVLTAFQGNHEMTFPISAEVDSNGLVTDLCVEVMSRNCNAGMGMYIMKREALIAAVRYCVQRGRYHFERDFLLRKFNNGEITVHGYLFHSVALFNNSTIEYYRNSMALLDPDVFRGIFSRKGFTVYTKVRDAVPSYYGKESTVENCLTADGCRLLGEVSDSIIFRDVKIDKKAKVKDCVIMQGCVIGEGAELEGLILDKNVIVAPYAVLKGSKDHPLIIEKGASV